LLPINQLAILPQGSDLPQAQEKEGSAPRANS